VPVTEPFRRLPDAPVNRFRHSFESTPIETLTLVQALETIRTGRYQAEVRVVRAVLARAGKAAYDKAKARLAAFTFGGTFAPSRGNAHLQQHTGIVHGDLDHLSDVAAVKQAICRDPCTVYAFVSPSGGGLKLGVHVPVVADPAGYQHAWYTVSTAYERRYGGRWDPSGKDISRLCYVSHDLDLFWNPAAEMFDVPPAPIPEPRPPQRSVSRQGHASQGYAARAIDTAVQMIQAAARGTRHHARLRAARLLGGYVAGGMLSEEHAYGMLAQALVGYTEDLPRALKTVQDGLRYGQANPITLNDLEAERQKWIQAHPLSLPQSHHQPSAPPKSNPWDGIITLPLRPFARRRGINIQGRWVHDG
jgi:VirE N-terminal domain